jgi:regulation of enolase protein 1 (concanavalin A-like superfamily)
LRITSVFILDLLATFSVLAAPAPQPRPWVIGWLEVNPDMDCKFVRMGEKLTIEIPAREHDYLMNAPMLLREVAGDFVVQVHVRSGGFLTNAGLGEVRLAYAGLVIFFDDNTCLLFRKSWARKREVPNDSNIHCFIAKKVVRKDGQIELGNYRSLGDFTDQPSKRDEILLRLERKGNDLCPILSEDGKTWQKLNKITWSLPKTLKLGVIATNPLEQPFKPQFDCFKLEQKIQRKSR